MEGLHPHYQYNYENDLLHKYNFINWIGLIDLPFYYVMNYDKH